MIIGDNPYEAHRRNQRRNASKLHSIAPNDTPTPEPAGALMKVKGSREIASACVEMQVDRACNG
jgi:hypothetical protein